MFKTTLIALLPLLLFLGNGAENLFTGLNQASRNDNTGTLEKMIVARGTVTMDLNMTRLNGTAIRQKGARTSELRFDTVPDSFFTTMIYNDELRAALPSSMAIVPQGPATLPAKLSASYQDLIVEQLGWGSPYELVIRDGKSGFTFFNIEGHEYAYEPRDRSLNIQMGRMLISQEFASELGRPGDAGSIIGQILIKAELRPIEVTQLVDGQIISDVLPADPMTGTIPGPDVVVGDVNGLAQFGVTGSQVGLGLGTDSCNFGTVDLNWFQLPSNDHPVIPQNVYRMSGGATNDLRFEQIGQSQMKHAFTALTNNICNLGCNGVGGTRLGSGCSDPYSASLNATPNLGSRAWVNPFTGFYPRGDSATPPNTHSGHTHPSGGALHRILTEINDLRSSLNVGATYYAEGQYVTPHEYAWCVANPTQCNMYNNVSYRRYNVNGDGSPFSFSPAAATVRQRAAITAWPGAATVEFHPAPREDGIGTVAYKVTQTSTGVWHYEYAVYNQNLERGIQSFSIPIGAGITLTNVGFHAPPQHAGWVGDGTFNNAGYSSTPWAQSQAGGAMTWSTETFAINPNANAIRWGTMYNFRFDSNRPPQAMNATLGFFKTGTPITVPVQGPMPAVAAAVTVSGRVMTATGQGIASRVTITNGSGYTRSINTGSFGHYSFTDVPPGGTFTITAQAGKYTFTPRVIPITDHLAGVDFTAAPN